MKYQGLTFRNTAEKTVEIDIEGVIGYSWKEIESDIITSKTKMQAELKKLGNLEVDTIIVNINSIGGMVDHAISIHDLLASNKARVITKVNGMTASAATIIAMAGDERHMSDNALFLIHNASNWAAGNSDDLRVIVDELETVDKTITNIYSKVTGQSSEDLQVIMKKGKGRGDWMTAVEAKKLGFITNIFEPTKAAATFSNEIMNEYGLPQLPEAYLNQPPVNNIDEEKIATSIFAQLKTFIRDLKPNSDKPKNNFDMKKFPLLAVILNAENVKLTDPDTLELNEANLTAIEGKLAENATASADLVTQTAAIDAIDPTVAEAETTETKINAVQTLINAAPATVATAVDDDPEAAAKALFAKVGKDEINAEVLGV